MGRLNPHIPDKPGTNGHKTGINVINVHRYEQVMSAQRGLGS